MNRRYNSYSNANPPGWFVFLTGLALVMGMYYLWQGGLSYLSTGGLGVAEATQRAQLVATSTAEQAQLNARPTFTPIPTFTDVPACQTFTVNVDSAVVRQFPTTNSPQLEVWNRGVEVCVVQQLVGTDWYQIDWKPLTKRIDEAYMHQDVIEPLYPTATPTDTKTPLPSVTPIIITLVPTTDPNIPPTVTPIPLPTITPIMSVTPMLTLPTPSAIPIFSA